MTVMLTIVSHGHNIGAKQESKSITIMITDSHFKRVCSTLMKQTLFNLSLHTLLLY